MSLSLANFDCADIARLPQAARDDLNFWMGNLRSVVELGSPITRAMQSVARANGIAVETLERRYYTFKKSGFDWRALVDKRLVPEMWSTTGSSKLPADFIEHWKTIQQRYQRDTTGKAAHRALVRSWMSGEQIPGYDFPPVPDLMTGIPRGWSYANLSRYKLTKYERKAVRVGRSSASAMLPKVLSTRVNLQPGQMYVVDDQDYDVHTGFVGVNRKMTRPSGFNALDLSSGDDFFRGFKPTILNPDGTKQKLRQIDFDWFLVGILTTVGYREDTGTVIVGEHGTAKSGKDFLARVQEATNGKVTWDASGIHGEQLCGLFRGQPRGNPRYKAARESWFSLLRSEMAALPGPTGKDRHHAPEENYGLDIYTRQILDAATARPDLADRLRLPVLRWDDFLFSVNAITDIINNRTDHDLEGWEAMGRITAEWRLVQDAPWMPVQNLLALPPAQKAIADALIQQTPGLWKNRKLSPAEVWGQASGGLTKVSGAAVPVLLGPDAARPVTVTDDHSFVIEDGEISPEPMQFDSALTNGRIIEQGRKCLAYLNPYVSTELQICDESGRWLGVAERVNRICKTDTEALARRYGHVRKIESALLAPVARRGSAIARERIEMRNANSQLLAGPKQNASRLPSADDLDTLTDRDPVPADQDDTDPNDLAQQLSELT
ncbi:MAG: hypothetical protein WCO94_05760 [Verrucomicrobiota bacterium]